MNRYTFMKGWMRVPLGDKLSIRKEILDVFKHYSRPFWTDLLYGRKPLNLDQMESVEAIFKNRGIKKIWGEK